MSELTRRFPAGHRMLCDALEREHVPMRLVQMDMLYTGVSWAIRVQCREAAYERQEVLCPYDLWADTAFFEMCESIAQDVAQALANRVVDGDRGGAPSRL
ncbi:MAG TPA: hypothetical protein VFO60_05495 [Candidatus Dormibacteraeota bacterium]|nr:hypothetical protein [Candidatus Dormibacteraeota bacterium]